MKISTRGRYALRIMLDLALADSGRPVRVRDIAGRQEISEKYMEQIISILNKAGFVRSIRGPQGGYYLARKPSEYTAGMILRLTEGSMAPVDCVEPEASACRRKDGCAACLLWKRLDEAVRGVIDAVTLEDLVNWSREGGQDYII